MSNELSYLFKEATLPHPPAPPENNLVDMLDYKAVRNNIFDKAKDAVIKAFPIENEKYAITAEDVDYHGPRDFSLAEQKKALLEGRTISRKLRGKWVVTDKATGKQVGKSNLRTLMNVPYLTDRGTYINNGNELTVSRQLRLSSGIYTRKTADGNVEAQFNPKPGTGYQFRVFMEPATSVFFMRYHNRKIPLFPVLRAMGYSHDDLKKTWGDKIYDANKVTETSSHAINFIRSFAPTDEGSTLQKTSMDVGTETRNNLITNFSSIELDPDATLATTGVAYTRANPASILGSTKKILSIAKGEQDVDNRDSLQFQTVHDTGDFLAERILADKQLALRKVLWKLTNKAGDVTKIPTAPLDKHISDVYNNSSLAQYIEEINPLDTLDQNQRVTRLGTGGISSQDSVPKEARNVQHTYLNYIDPIRGPESRSVGVDLRFSRNVRIGKKDNQLYTQFLDKSGKPRWVSAKQASQSVVSFPEELSNGKQFVKAIINGKDIGVVPRKDVDFYVPHADDLFSHISNTVPAKSTIKGMRLNMGSRFAVQALPLVNREAPYVRAATPSEEDSHESFLGKFLGAVKAPRDGVVQAVRKDKIDVV